MENYRKRPRKKNKKVKKAVLIIGLPVLAVIIVLSAIFSVVSGFLPSVAVSVVEDYKKAAELVGCTWQELVVYDTVRFENEMEDVNPYLSALDFLKMHYEIYEYIDTEDVGGYWSLVTSGNLNNPEDICSWLGISKDSDIKAVLNASKKYTRPEFVIQFNPKDLDELIIEKNFSKEQIEWSDMLMTSGVMEQMFGEIYDLPDYIESAGGEYFGWPTPDLHTVTSPFAAARKHPVLGITRPHNGVDISGANAMGSPVCSIDDGVVIQIDLKGGERGKNIKVKHTIGEDVWVSRYQHLSVVKVTIGQKVHKGTVIGAVGNTGIGTGAHLHIELTYNGVLLDPLPLIQ